MTIEFTKNNLLGSVDGIFLNGDLLDIQIGDYKAKTIITNEERAIILEVFNRLEKE